MRPSEPAPNTSAATVTTVRNFGAGGSFRNGAVIGVAKSRSLFEVFEGTFNSLLTGRASYTVSTSDAIGGRLTFASWHGSGADLQFPYTLIGQVEDG